MPLIDPTVYAMAELRHRNLAFATIRQAMYGVRILIQFLEALEIDLAKRVHKEGIFLEMHEIENIARLCKVPSGRIAVEMQSMKQECGLPIPNIKNLEQFRASARKDKVPQVSTKTANIRLIYVRSYLKWLAHREMLKVDGSAGHYPAVRESIEIALDKLKVLRASTTHRNTVGSRRRGLSEKVIARIHEVVDPESPENPWRGKFNRLRNRVYIYWLLDLAVRKGESLGVLLEDIDFSSTKVSIMRRPDNPKDPRGPYAPLAKTRDRVLVVSDDLLSYTAQYLEERRKLPDAKGNGYLFVSSWNGAPLSQSAARDIFHHLRKKVPGIPATLCAQVLRHAWNSTFTAHAYETGMSDRSRLDIMRNQNGWSDRSDRQNHDARKQQKVDDEN